MAVNLPGWADKLKHWKHARKAKILLAVGIFLALIGPIFNLGRDYAESLKLQSKINKNPVWAEMYSSAKAGNKLLKAAQNEEPYIAAAFRWKSLADATGEKDFYLKARDIYDQAIARKDFKNPYLSCLNAGNVSRAVGEYDRADKYYQKAIELNPGEASTYMARAELWRYDLKKDSKEIEKFYADSLKPLIGQEYVRLATEYAAYLKQSGNFGEALKQYKLLLLVRPAYEPYKDSIREIEAKIQAASVNQ